MTGYEGGDYGGTSVAEHWNMDAVDNALLAVLSHDNLNLTSQYLQQRLEQIYSYDQMCDIVEHCNMMTGKSRCR